MNWEPQPGADPELLEPVTSPRLSDLIAERITQAIKDGSLKPGDRLPTEHALARQLGVGRTSVREGMQKLRTLGVVEVRKGLGAYVAEGDGDDQSLPSFVRWAATNVMAIEELVEARIALEALAAALAAERATPEELAEIDRLEQAHAEAAHTDVRDTDRLVRSDEAFHDAIMAAARNHFVTRMYGLLISELTAFRRHTLALPWAPDRSAEGHAAICAALRAGDAPLAREAMIDHLWVLYGEIRDSAVAADGELPLKIAPRAAFG